MRTLPDLAPVLQINSQNLVKHSVLPKQHRLPTHNYFLSLNIHDLHLKKKFKSLVIILTSLTYWNFSSHHRGILLMVYKVM